MVEVAKMARSEALGVLGLNEAHLWWPRIRRPLREAWRLALFSLIGPLGNLVESELRAKIDPGISLSWTELQSQQILAGRARAFKTMVEAGKTVEEATQIAGLMLEE